MHTLGFGFLCYVAAVLAATIVIGAIEKIATTLIERVANGKGER